MPDFKRDYLNINVAMVKTMMFFAIMIALFGALSDWTESTLLEKDQLIPERNKSIYAIQREPEETIDILVLGDSLSYSSVSPMSLWNRHGYTAFVCGQPGQNMFESEELLKIALETQSPKVVILETNAIIQDRLKGRTLNDTMDTLFNYYLPLFRGHDVWKSLVMKKEYAEVGYTKYKGFPFRGDVKPYEEGSYMNKTDKKAELPEKNVEHLQNILDMCRDCGADLILLGTPSPSNYNYSVHNAIAEYAEKQGLTYLDMILITDEIGIDWNTDTLDKGDHLNLSGTEKVTEYLGRYLSDNYSLTDHRGDAAFDQWTKVAAEYDEKASQKLKEMRGKQANDRKKDNDH